jgi:hypothetical protein
MKVKEAYALAEELIELMVSGDIDSDDAIAQIVLEFPVLSFLQAEALLDSAFAAA